MKIFFWVAPLLILVSCAQDEQHARWDSLHYPGGSATHNYCNESDIACSGKNRSGGIGGSKGR